MDLFERERRLNNNRKIQEEYMQNNEIVSPMRVGVFIDGFTFRKVNEYYRIYHDRHSPINFVGLKNWINHEVIKLFKPQGLIAMESHYYHPYEDPRKSGSQRYMGTLQFESRLVEAGIQVHYSSIDLTELKRPNTDLIDDAVIFAMYRKIDVAVLLSTQGQYASLPPQLKMMGVPTLLLGWNFEYPATNYMVKWHTDALLRERSSHYVAMEKVMGKENGAVSAIVNKMFQKQKAN